MKKNDLFKLLVFFLQNIRDTREGLKSQIFVALDPQVPDLWLRLWHPKVIFAVLLSRTATGRAEHWRCVFVRRSVAVLRCHFQISLWKHVGPQSLAWPELCCCGSDAHLQALQGRGGQPHNCRTHPCTGLSPMPLLWLTLWRLFGSFLWILLKMLHSVNKEECEMFFQSVFLA